MLESFIKEGSQPFLSGKKPLNGISITDPCLSLEDTQKLLISANESLSAHLLYPRR
jgi:phospho-2-dehydro-3-deoxyheptonate aldolase